MYFWQRLFCRSFQLVFCTAARCRRVLLRIRGSQVQFRAPGPCNFPRGVYNGA